MFKDCDNILEVDFSIRYLNVKVLNFENMFSNCNSLSSVNIFDIDLETGDQNISLNYMFSNCSVLASINIFNIQIKPNTGKGYLYMNNMFSGGLSLSTANFSNIYEIANKKGYIYMNNTFKDCTSLSIMKFFYFVI